MKALQAFRPLSLRRGGVRFTRAIVFAATLLSGGCYTAHADPVPIRQIEVDSRPIRQFRIGREDRRFGPLEFVGGLEMTSSSREFGGLSSMRFLERRASLRTHKGRSDTLDEHRSDPKTGSTFRSDALSPGSDFLGVTDTGFWFFGKVTRDADHRPTGMPGFRMVQMVDATGVPFMQKWENDAEGLAVRDGIATVSFERNHRVTQYRIDPDNMQGAFRKLDFLVPAHELRVNRGFETVAHAPVGGALDGALTIVSEKSLDSQGNIFAAILSGPAKGVFSVRRSGDFDITDGAFLPGGDLLLLERSFSMVQGVRMRLRRLAGSTIGKGKLADGPVLLQADMSYQIDNMEAMDVWRRSDGAVMVSLMSDDNHSILQRNLYLEFILHED